MVVKIVQGILLMLDTVNLIHVLSMQIGQHGQSGVTAARHVPMAQDLATEHVVVPTHSLGVETVLAKKQKHNSAMQCLVLFMVNGPHGHSGPSVALAAPVAQKHEHELATTLPPPMEATPALGMLLKLNGAR